jgi:hypothetical protein
MSRSCLLAMSIGLIALPFGVAKAQPAEDRSPALKTAPKTQPRRIAPSHELSIDAQGGSAGTTLGGAVHSGAGNTAAAPPVTSSPQEGHYTTDNQIRDYQPCDYQAGVPRGIYVTLDGKLICTPLY